MPIRWFICPDAKRIEVKQCLAEGGCRRPNRCATRGYLQLVSKEREWTGKPSTTQCINGTMRSWLLLTNEYAVSPDDRAFMIHGTTGHASLEGAADPHSIQEQWLDGDETGIFDTLENELGKYILADHKTSGSYMVAKALGWFTEKVETDVVFKSGPRKGQLRTKNMLKRDDSRINRRSWELQLNNYRMKVEKLGIHVDEMRIMCIVRDGNTYIARNRGVFNNTYYFKIRRMPDEEVEAYFRKKRNALAIALRHGWTTPCSHEENWDGIRCASYCEVAEFCPYGKYLKKDKELENMPIEGVSNVRWLPRQGWIRLGEMRTSKKTGKEHPAEVDYFILKPATPNEDESARLIGKFHKLYGDKPKRIQVMLPSSDPELVFPQYYERYGAGSGLKCRGDGKQAICMNKEFTKDLEVTGKLDGLTTVVCKGKECPYQTSKPVQCSRSAKLNVLLPDLEGAGTWTINTGSFYSIVNVNSWMEYIQHFADRAHMIPFWLERRETEIAHNGSKTKHYPLYVDTSIPMAQLARFGKVQAADVALKLPGLSEDRYELVFEITPESTIHAEGPGTPDVPKELPEKTDGGALTFEIAVAKLSDMWGEEQGSVSRFILDHSGTKAEGLLMMRKALDDSKAAAQMFGSYETWIEALKKEETQEDEHPDFEIPEEETDDKPATEETAEKGEITYHSALFSLSGLWTESAESIDQFLKKEYGTEAKAFLQLRKLSGDKDGLLAIFGRYQEWNNSRVDEAADEEEEANPVPTPGVETITTEQMDWLREVMPGAGMGKAFRNKKFDAWWREELGADEKATLLTITVEKADQLIGALEQLAAEKGGGSQGKLAL